MSAFALPWFGNEASTLSPMAAVVTALLVITAVLAFVLTWLLQTQQRRVRALERRLQSERALRQATLDALPFPVALHGVDGQLLASNALSRDVADDDSLIRLLQQASFAEQKRRLLQGDTLRQDLNFAGQGGEAHAARRWIRALRDERDQVQGYARAQLDITEFRNAEQAARQTEQGLGEMARQLPVVIVDLLLDARGLAHLRFLTGDTRTLFNLDADELRDDDGVLRTDRLRECIHPDDLPAVLALLSKGAHRAEAQALDFRTFGRQGQRWVHATFTTHAADDGLGVMGYCIDTTEQQQRSEALLMARDVAERASKAKADFLAAMSHEIRTPMNGVIGMLELLGRTRLDGEQQELLHAVDESAGSLMQILNDILDFSKLEAGDLRLDIAPFDARQWLDGALTTMAPAARAKGLDLRIWVDPAAAGQWRGDSQRLRQILINLLNNAIKFTERGSVSVALTVLGDSGTQQHLALSVTDTGIGIAQDKQGALFQAFTQAESWTSRRYGGTGLGLAICQQLAQLMQGSIELSSDEGIGTRVTLQWRLSVAARATDAPASLHGRHAIVRLASADTAHALDAYLRAAGLSVERLEPSAPLRAGMAASLLFIDADDHDSTQQVHAHAVIVAAEPLAPGHTATWLSTQPLTWRAVLRACLHALDLDVAEHAHDAPSAGELPALQGRVLVVEDHPTSQRLIARQLAQLGITSDVVDNGEDALEILADGDYALLLTDCNMPLMSGYELARAWRAQEAASGAARLPILAMTANALGHDAERARAAGMDDVLSKPLRLATLGARLSEWLGHLPAPPAEGPPPAELQALLAEETRRDLDELQYQAARRDLPAARRSLHRLMGVLPLLCEPALVQRSEQLYEALLGPAGEHALAGVADLVAQLSQQLELGAP